MENHELTGKISVIEHRVSTLEQVHRDIPSRVARLEFLVEEIPIIKLMLADQGKEIKEGFEKSNDNFGHIKFAIMGAAILWAFLTDVGPKLLSFLGN